MTTPPDAAAQASLASPGIAAATRPAPRTLYWSIRREVWENRSVYVAPLCVAAVFLFGFTISALLLPRRLRAVSLDPAKLNELLVTPFPMAAAVIIMTAYVVGAFYCLDALHGERRDRSILFWKSLPVSDRTTVLSKASIPLAVLPLIAFAVSLVVQLAMLSLSSAVLAASGLGPALLWTRVSPVQMALVTVYALIVHALWHAPIYAWLLLLSAWARRVVFLWAVLPLAAVGILERVTFQTSHFAHLIQYRLGGGMELAFVQDGHCPILVAQLQPLRFLGSPGLWTGLIAAAAFLAATVRLRRRREPI